MSTKCLSWGIEQTTGSTARKIVLLLLCDLADEQFTCYPRREYLAVRAELSQGAVSNAISQLQRDGFVRVLRRARRRGGRTSNRYLVCVNGADTPLPEVDDWVREFVPDDETPGESNSAPETPLLDDADEPAGQSNSHPETPLPEASKRHPGAHSNVTQDDVSSKEDFYPLVPTQDLPPPPPTITHPAGDPGSEAADDDDLRDSARLVLRDVCADVADVRLPNAAERYRLVEQVAELLAGEWSADQVSARLRGMGTLRTVASVYAVLNTRLRHIGNPPYVVPQAPVVKVGAWCGQPSCDRDTRRQVDDEGRPRFALDGGRYVPLYCENCSGR
jgi:hypothetical protein